MLDLKVVVGGEVKDLPILNFDRTKIPRLRRGMMKAGKILNVQIREHLRKYKGLQSLTKSAANKIKGYRRSIQAYNPSFTGRDYEFPKYQSGQLFGRVYNKLTNDNGIPGQVVGPNTEYAAIQEFGGRTGRGGNTIIPPRPYVAPAWKVKEHEVMSVIVAELMEGL